MAKALILKGITSSKPLEIMCSHLVLRSILIGVSALLFIAIGIITAAIVVNSNFITSWYTPIALGIAIGTLAGIIAFLVKFLNDLRNFDLCVNSGFVFNFCRGRFSALYFAVSALIGLLGSQIVNLGTVMAVAWAPGTAIPQLGITIQVLSSILGVILISIWAFYANLITCLKRSPVGFRVTPMTGRQTPLPAGSDRMEGKVEMVTCTLQKADCADASMVKANFVSGVYLTAKTFALLFKPPNNLTIQNLKAELTDAYQHTIQLDTTTDYFAPGNHSFQDSSYYAVRVRWDYVSKKGIRAETSYTARKWILSLEMTLSDGSIDKIKSVVLVSN